MSEESQPTHLNHKADCRLIPSLNPLNADPVKALYCHTGLTYNF